MKRLLLSLSLGLLLLAAANGGEDQASAPAPAFSGKTTTGETLALADLKGKVVLLDFWASWCAPCREELPFLVQVHEKAKKHNFTVLAVNVDTEREKMQSFLNRLATPPGFPVIADPEGKIPALFDLKGMPTTVLIDRKGIIRFRHTGFTEKEKARLVEEIRLLLQES